MDYCDKLTFKHLIEEHAKKMTYIPEEEILNYLAMITMGLAEMHRKFIIHFDLKPENIFLFGDKYVKIGDFGTSVSLGSDKNKVKKLVGTQYYVSPEMLDGEPCNMSTDIWSLGVILYQLIQLHLPFDASNLIDLSSKIRRGIPAVPFQQMKCSQQLKEIVQWLLEPDPSKRPTAVQLLEHSLLKERAQRLFMQVPPSLRLVDEKLIYVRPGEEKDDINKYQLNMGQHLHGIQYI
ncbi:MAG: putative AGC family protein kinase [Streblomastix strix]|uniref:non-specific serine/threonine protein kinase n=1 Tax=Streblomastix strix TaxID=222440 RepID=A0A5J4VS77_9EUKA|nr:MAG: putative AGC family protein kinase [Streblomastix strix]